MVQIEISGMEAIQAQLQRLQGMVGDLTPVMGEIGQKVETNIRNRFETKTAPSGHAWEPYKAISAAIHRARTGSAPTGSLLQRTVKLQGSAEHHAGADFVEVGLSNKVAQYHEFGTAGRTSKTGKPYGAIPRRGMVFGSVSGVGAAAQVTQALSASDEADVMDIIQRHISAAITG